MSTTQDPQPASRRTARLIVLTALIAAVASVGSLALLTSIFEHKVEAREPFFRVVRLTESTEDPAVWGRNFPHQYDAYRRTVDQTRTRFGGSEAMPRTPSGADPRTVVAQSRLEEDPRLRTLWAGYAFSRDFREERGHGYMLLDQTYTGRQAVPQPGTCLNCHASVWGAYRRLGNGDIFRGFEALNHLPYAAARQQVSHPVACIDCHDPETMRLRVTRPAFIEGMRARLGRPDYDPNRDASREEMRAFVCGQCHVEYYFRGPEKRLVYPWALGLRVDDIYQYYSTTPLPNGQLHRDWQHADSGASTLKAQHPEFEMWNQGVHARSGVTCADCHMPYTRVGALKISDHHVRSPLLNLNNACQNCHPIEESELRARVEDIQANTFRLRNIAMDAVVALIRDLQAARAAGRPDAELANARELQRRAQFYLDFIEAENSMGFHAPQEASRVLGEAMNYARQGQLALRDPNFRAVIVERASVETPRLGWHEGTPMPPPASDAGTSPAPAPTPTTDASVAPSPH